ncbi:NADH-ubiquinone oxidoreductase-F iron-sulfur binding region domain-containing protein [Nocardia sp. NPDC088792]|uniref:NADH-ubiquinone oxidoreductase-F iron-sulfur binding region domain-containing protein n=1 Tax=Nocardia sp. NPDC088792 TaxID=3364332 RepID=UPI0038012C99
MIGHAPRVLGVDSGIRLLAADTPQLNAHMDCYGPLPAVTPALIDAVAEAGLRGRGGAGFPMARKLAAVASGRKPIIVANGAEGEPESRKDAVLLTRAPHLVLDGLFAAAAAVGSRSCRLYAPAAVLESVRRALAERRAAGFDEPEVELTAAAETFLAGEKTAVLNRLAGRAAVPGDLLFSTSKSGLEGRPTLVQNVETLAHLGLIARFGPHWFRTAGTDDEPGTMLITLTGTAREGVFEVPAGIALPEVICGLGGTEPTGLRAVLIGGRHGTWVSGGALAHTTLSEAGLRHVHASPGAGVLRVLPRGQCGLYLTAAITGYLAEQSTRQCGPCRNGLPRLAAGFADLVHGDGNAGELEHVAELVEGRGACHHPDGTARLVRSALTVFASDIQLHRRGTCETAMHAKRIGAL